MKNLYIAFVLCIVIFYFPANAQKKQALAVKWQLLSTDTVKGQSHSQFIFYNKTNEPLALGKLNVWFTYILNPPSPDRPGQYTITHQNGDLYQLNFTDEELTLASADSLCVPYTSDAVNLNFSDAPSGLYVSSIARKIFQFTRLGIFPG